MLTRFRQTGWAIALWALVLLIFAVAFGITRLVDRDPSR